MIGLLPYLITLLMVSAPATSDEVTHVDEVPVLSDGQLGGDFKLHASHGPFSLKQLRGKVVLLYFGYTKCPDVCPTALASLAQVFNELSDDELKSVQGVFVSVDPKRDSFDLLDNYVSYFHSNLIGITGSQSEIAEVAKRYGVNYQEVVGKGSAFGYTIDHSSTIYLITPEGKIRFVFPHQTPSFVILEAIKYLLESN
jgi:protein SCO1/2